LAGGLGEVFFAESQKPHDGSDFGLFPGKPEFDLRFDEVRLKFEEFD
jgi:hypothetical protein